jgi:hypothetical protein
MRRRISLFLLLSCICASAAIAQTALPGSPAPSASAMESGIPGTRHAYRLLPPPTSAAATRALYPDPKLLILEKLNRVDRVHLFRLREMVVPDTISANEIDYCPLPLVFEWGDTLGKLLVVDQPAQVFGAYEYGRLQRWGPVSTGRKESRTPSGLFHLNWKTKGRHSTVDSLWFLPWYFNFDSKSGVSLHQYELPGRPASHSCVRLLEPDAIWIYGWGEQWRIGNRPWIIERPGTPLLILGRCDYDAPWPWMSTEWLAHGVPLPPNPPTAQDWTGAGKPE